MHGLWTFSLIEESAVLERPLGGDAGSGGTWHVAVIVMHLMGTKATG